MPRRVALLAGIALVALAGCLHAPVLWSPDGRWLAYTTAVHPVEEVLAPGWLFATNASHPATEPAKRSPPTSYRLWATRVETGHSVLLEDSKGPLTSPCWRPDGGGLAFGRLVTAADGQSRFQVVLQDNPEHNRVLLEQPCDVRNPRLYDLPALALAWSPDGRYLAIPLFQQTLGLAIIRADNGRLLKIVEDAFLPSWSPDGSKLAFVRGNESESLHYIDTNFGPPRHLADIGRTSQAPVWSRDKQSVQVVARRRVARGVDPFSQETLLIRVPVDGGKAEERQLDKSQITEKTDEGVAFAFDPDGETLFFTLDVEGQKSEVTWYHPRNSETYKKDNPVDFTVRIGSMAVAPNGKKLAFRVGGPGDFPPPAILDVADDRFTPIVPDDSARVEWIGTLVHGALQLLKALPPATIGKGGRIVERATVLPIPGDWASNSESIVRLRRIGRIGRPICDRPADAHPADPDVERLLDEARLFFDYLKGDYRSALSSLEKLEAGTDSPDKRLRLLSVRAQIFVGQGERERSEHTISYLQSIERSSPRRFEETTAGPTMTEERSTREGWPKLLAKRASDVFNPPPADGSADARGMRAMDGHNLRIPGEPFGHRNFADLRRDDVPLVNVEDEPLPNGAIPRMPVRIVPPEPGILRPPPAPLPPDTPRPIAPQR